MAAPSEEALSRRRAATEDRPYRTREPSGTRKLAAEALVTDNRTLSLSEFVQPGLETGLLSTPTPSMVMSIRSPSFRNTGGFM